MIGKKLTVLQSQKIEKNLNKINQNAALNIFFINYSDKNNIDIKKAYISSYNLAREKKLIYY